MQKASSGSGHEADREFNGFNRFNLKERVHIGFGQRNNVTGWKNALTSEMLGLPEQAPGPWVQRLSGERWRLWLDGVGDQTFQTL